VKFDQQPYWQINKDQCEMSGMQWKTVILTTFVVFIFMLSSFLLQELPPAELNERSDDDDKNNRNPGGARHPNDNAMRLFPDDDVDDDVKPKVKAKRENALQLFDDDGDDNAGHGEVGDKSAQKPKIVDDIKKPKKSIDEADGNSAERKRLEERAKDEVEEAAAGKKDKKNGANEIFPDDDVGARNKSAHAKAMEAALRNKNDTVLIENVHAVGAIIKKLKHDNKTGGASNKVSILLLYLRLYMTTRAVSLCFVGLTPRIV